MLKKGVIEVTEHEEGEFISPIFLREKPDGAQRFILNLKELNNNLDTIHFKMDTIYTVLDLVFPNCYMASIDLKDAYYTVPIKDECKKYFKFKFEDRLFQFVCLPNGYCHGPRKFTKLLKPPLAHLRMMDHIIASYIDDLINIGADFQECTENVVDTLLWLVKLGFAIHPDKSQLFPSQIITFLGFVIDSVSMTIKLTEKKKIKIYNICQEIIENPNTTIRKLSSIIGKITSSFPGVQFGPLHYRDLERNKCEMLRLNKGNYDSNMRVSQEGLKELFWWRDNIMNSFANIRRNNPTLSIQTDACLTGWGAVFNGVRAHGGFKREELEGTNINILELRAVLLGLQSHLAEAIEEHILVFSDNTTTVQGINKMGSSKSPNCNTVIRDIWRFVKKTL